MSRSHTPFFLKKAIIKVGAYPNLLITQRRANNALVLPPTLVFGIPDLLDDVRCNFKPDTSSKKSIRKKENQPSFERGFYNNHNDYLLYNLPSSSFRTPPEEQVTCRYLLLPKSCLHLLLATPPLSDRMYTLPASVYSLLAALAYSTLYIVFYQYLSFIFFFSLIFSFFQTPKSLFGCCAAWHCPTYRPVADSRRQSSAPCALYTVLTLDL